MNNNNKLACLTLGLMVVMVVIESQLAPHMPSLAYGLVIGAGAILMVGIVVFAQSRLRRDGPQR